MTDRAQAEARGGIVISGVSKRFGPVTALHDVTFSVDEGEIAVLLGPNGSGKSTLLRILGTTVLADAGRIRVAGHDVSESPNDVRSSVGFLLADERSWYWRLTGRHNLEFFSALHGLSKGDCTKRTTELLEEVGLSTAADRPFGEYSSGMRLRLSLARALVSSPPVLLLDEPTRSLDALAKKHFSDLVLQMTRERKASVLIATHDLHEAATVASRVIVLVGGRLRGTSEGPADSTKLEQILLKEEGG